MSENPIITAVIPVRLSMDWLYDEPERIARIIATLPAGYVPLIVDYGTAEERAGELRNLATATSTKLVRVETGDEPFSVGHARDIGTQHAQTPLILYHDIDFLMSPRSYERVLEETRLRGMPGNAYAFFALPGVYLTEEFTRRYLELFAEGDAAFADTVLHDAVMRRDRSLYENHTYAISAIVASRYHLLAIGGHDKSFVGHGAEDFELLHRLASYAPRGPRPGTYYLNTRNNSISRYEGFRAHFALYGIDLFQRGLQVAHLWHPRRQDSAYVAPMAENQERVSQAMADYDTGTSWLPPLEDLHAPTRTLALIKDGRAPQMKALRHAFPAFGRFDIRRESEFSTGEQLLRHMEDGGFARVFFLNPYGSAHRLSLYEAVKAAVRQFIVWDRGGLHDSWFFDPGGFLAESTSYRPERWDRPLYEAENRRTLEWLAEHRDSQTLEENGPRIGAEALGQRLQADGRKVIFVALQRPEDTATKFFAGPCGGTEGFNDWIAHLARALDPQDYLVLAKKHPLEENMPSIPNVRFVEPDTHIMDLIDLAAAIVVINSGVGLIGLSNGKPVICCGDAYYAHPGLARAVSDRQELAVAVREARRPDEEKRLRFFRYLIEDFYSFGAPRYSVKMNKHGDRIRSVTRIVFSSIRGIGDPIELGRPPRPISLKAALYFSFGGREAVQAETTPINKLIEMGLAAYLAGDSVEADRLFEIANRRKPNNRSLSRAIVQIAEAVYQAGQQDEAIRLLEKARDWVPEDRNTLNVTLGLAEAAQQTRYAEAFRLLEITHDWAPEDKRPLRMVIAMGKSACQAGQFDEALRLLETAHGWAPKDKNLYRFAIDSGNSAYQAGHHREAVRFFEAAHAWAPNNKGPLRALTKFGEEARSAGDHAQAVRLLEIAHGWAPADKKLHRDLLESGVQRHGGPLAELIIASSSALKDRARKAFARADLREATLLFTVLHLREPQKIDHLRCLAECYLNSDGRGQAEQCLEEALSLAPDNKSIRRRLEYVRSPWWRRRFKRDKAFMP